MYDVYHIASETKATITDTCDIRDPNSLFAASHLHGEGRTETRQTKTLNHFNGHFFCFSCPIMSLALKHGGFVPRDLWLPKCVNIRCRVY